MNPASKTTKKYLIINNEDYAWGLAINSVGHQSIAENEVYPPQIHPTRYLFNTQTGRTLDEYQLLYITSGKGMFYSESGGRHQVREGDMFLLFPGEWHTYRPEQTTGWNEYWIGFNGRIMEDWVKEGFFSKESRGQSVLPIIRTERRSRYAEVIEECRLRPVPHAITYCHRNRNLRRSHLYTFRIFLYNSGRGVEHLVFSGKFKTFKLDICRSDAH